MKYRQINMKAVKIILAVAVVATIGFFVWKWSGGIGEPIVVEPSMNQCIAGKIGSLSEMDLNAIAELINNVRERIEENQRIEAEQRQRRERELALERELAEQFWTLVRSGNTTMGDYRNLFSRGGRFGSVSYRNPYRQFHHYHLSNPTVFRGFSGIPKIDRIRAQSLDELRRLINEQYVRERLKEQAEENRCIKYEEQQQQQQRERELALERELSEQFWILVRSGNLNEGDYRDLFSRQGRFGRVSYRNPYRQFHHDHLSNPALFRRFRYIPEIQRRRAQTLEELKRLINEQQ